jgi:hypothetical protein
LAKINITSFTTARGVQFADGTCYLRLYYTRGDGVAFSFSDGEVWRPDSTTHYREYSGTVASNVVTMPTLEVQPTTDLTNTMHVRAKAVLLDANRAEDTAITLFTDWEIPHALGSTITFAQLETHNSGRKVRRIEDTETLNRQQIEELIEEANNVGNPATVGAIGRGAASVEPTDAAFPIFVEDNDPRVAGAGVWNHMGTVVPADGGNVGEPTVMYGPPFMLISSGFDSVFRMWHTATLGTAPGDWGTPATVYKESADGGTWFPYPTPVLPGIARNHFVKVGSVYHAFGSPDDHSIVHYTSANGVTGWTLVGTVVTDGGGGWKNNSVANSSFIVDGSTWYVFFDGFDGSRWQIGLTISTDGGATWTEHASNPVITLPAPFGVGQPDVHKINGRWYAFPQVMLSGVTPSDLYLFDAPAPAGPWALTTPEAFFPRTTQDEGAGNSFGQITGRMLEVDDRAYFFYTADVNGLVPEGHSHIKLAIADMTLARLVTTDGGVRLPSTAASRLSALDSAWTTYTPSVAPSVAGAGPFMTLGVRSASYIMLGQKTVAFRIDVTIATNGTGSGYVKLGLPFTAANVAFAGWGKEEALNGKALAYSISGGGTTADVTFYDNTYPGANGARLNIGGIYEIP